jgi:hypothetical protein
MKESATNSRALLDALFFDAKMVVEDKFQLKSKLDTDKATPELTGPERERVDKKFKELSGILGKLGIKDVGTRLVVVGDAFHLNSDHEQHTADSDILFDFSKIQPLIDKGYVTIDRESDGKNWAIIIMASDILPDIDLPDADDLEAVKFDNDESLPPVDSEKVDQLAERLVYKITNRH